MSTTDQTEVLRLGENVKAPSPAVVIVPIREYSYTRWLRAQNFRANAPPFSLSRVVASYTLKNWVQPPR